MTAVPSWDHVDPRNTDAALVRGSLAGDRAAFAQIYDRYADRLHDFCVGMLRDLDGAADCVQDTFCLAATRLPQLRDPDRLRPWLYAIARNEALRWLRDRRREKPSDHLPDIQSDDAGPDTLAARTELADLLADAAGGLTDRDRTVFDLAFRHGLNGPDLADALGVSHSNANTMVLRLRGTIERSLGALLVCRRHNATGGCAVLGEILAGWDGKFTVLMRKRVSRHIESCPDCDDERRRLVTPAALLGAAPVFIPAPEWLRERTLGEIQLTSHGSAIEGEPADAAGPDSNTDDPSRIDASSADRGRRRMMLAALLIAVLSGAAGLQLAWMNNWTIPFVPTETTETAPEPTAEPPPPSNPLPPQAPVSVPPPSVLPPAQTPTVEPTRQILPSSIPTPTDAAPPIEQPSVEEPSPPRIAPSSRPPMSFSPTVVVGPNQPPNSGGDGGGQRRAGSNPPAAGSAP
jgi:RNA polymerase sigma factor (sigma-70 family)